MNLLPEEKAREQIDGLLTAAGWTIQDLKELNLSASLGVAVREFPVKTGFADYMLFVDKKAVGVIEAKKAGTTLSGVADQTGKYIAGLPKNLPHVVLPLPFAYESTGIETFFRDGRDPDPRSRPVFAFHRPETHKEWLSQPDTLRARLKKLPPLITEGLRDCQIEAVNGLEGSLADDKPRSLIQMATGTGKTFTAVSFIYRLIKFANARRVLFLVDRGNLGRQTNREFQNYATPDDGRKFTQIYNAQHLQSNVIDGVNRVCITTIQRLYAMLRGEREFDGEIEEKSIFDISPFGDKPFEISYNPNIPIETFDFIVTDECHRSIYHLWKQVLEYFDAYIIGLTATPSKQTLGFFNQNLVMEYPHERAVADGVNVGYEVYRIKTKITEIGSRIEAGYHVDKRDKITRKKRWELLDEAFEYPSAQLDRDVVSPDQIRTIIKTFKEKLFTEIFPGRSEVPKTLIFAKNDSHAEDIVHIIREEFGRGNEFCKKITYKTEGEKPEDLISSFRNSYDPRIAVTVDMISTGTDIRPLECLVFMRDVQSRVYFEQMKGRGTRTISSDDFKSVTPDAENKTHFIIVDAIGVCENDKTESAPLERKKSVPFDKLVQNVALGIRDEDTLSSLAGRLARLDRELSDRDRKEIGETTGGIELKEIVNGLLDAIETDKQIGKAKEIFGTETPTDEQIQKAYEELAEKACSVFNNPKFRNTVIEIKQKSEQVIDAVSKDEVLFAGADETAKEKAKSYIDTFKKFIEDNRDELTALQIFYSKPYGQRHITHEQVRQLAYAIEKPPYNLTTEAVWKAYERLDRSKVRGAGTQKLLTNIISLLRFTVGEAEVLEPFTETVNQRFEKWIESQKAAGKEFSSEQMEWLVMIKDHIAASMGIEADDFEYSPFHDRGGLMKASQVFGSDFNSLLKQLNEVLAA